MGSAGQVAPTTCHRVTLALPPILPAVCPAVSCACGTGARSGGHPCLWLLRTPGHRTQRMVPASPGRVPCACRHPLLPGAVPGAGREPPDDSSPAPRGERSQEMSSASVKSDSERGRPPQHWAPCGTAALGPAPKSGGDSFLPGSSLSSALVSPPPQPSKLPAPTHPDSSTRESTQCPENR